MSDDLQLILLGKPCVSRNGIPLTGLSLRKSLALVAYLAVTG